MNLGLKNLIKKAAFCILYFRYIKFKYYFKTIFLGSNYGGWSFYNYDNLYRSTIISGGLGEDATFDIEFSAKYNSRIILVDPTPRAIEHFKKIIKNINYKNKFDYPKNTGNIPIESYDLSRVKKKNLIISKYALWDQNYQKLKFYEPQNKKYVSFSLLDKRSDNYISVKTISIKEIIKKYKIEKIELLKIDIEGSEYKVINNIIKDKIFPNQILVEVENLHQLNKKNLKEFTKLNKKLIKNNYILMYSQMSFPNLLYVRKNILK